MNIINLNTWGGVIKEPLIDFFDTHKDTDVFCLQEVLSDAYDEDLDCLTNETGTLLSPNLYQKILDALPEHVDYFTPVVGEHYGLACFVKKNISVLDHGEVLLYETKKFPDPENPDADHDRKMQWLLLDNVGQHYLVMNLHGHWKKDKLDDIDTSNQIKTILDFIQEFRDEGESKGEIIKVLAGDFNLLPETESIKKLGEVLNNVTLQNGVTTTRTSMHDSTDQIIDYVFVSKNTVVDSFEILSEEVSDHVAMKISL